MLRIEFLQKYALPGRLLDLGCGSMFLSSKLIGNFELYPTDIKRYRYENFTRCDACGVSFSDSFFDTVFAGELIEHLCDPGLLLAEINRVLRIGGRAIITTPNVYALERIKEHYLGRRSLGSENHKILFSWSSLVELLEAHSFEVVAGGYKRLPRLGTHVMICGEKC